MSNKLQELTDKLYNEGLSKGKEEGELLLSKAKQQAEELVQNAKQEAANIIAQAEKAAADIKTKAESDIKTASEQSLQATRSDIENLLVKTTIEPKINSALGDVDFLKEIIKTVAEKFSSEEAVDVNLVLPATLQAELEPWISGELAKLLQNPVSAEFSKKISGGFTIGPKNGAWFVSLSEESFCELIAEYLRPITRKILFG